jgi:hypothetical protein
MKRAIGVLAGMAIAGVLIGAVWVAVAPPVHGAIALTKSGQRLHAYLGDEADHFFVAGFMMAGLLAGAGVIAAVALWQWRAHRGPWEVIVLSLGGLAAAGAATGVGAAVARAYYGGVDVAGAPVTPQHRVHYVTEAPTVFFGHSSLQVLATLLMPAAAAALTYAALAAGSARDDLGVTAAKLLETAG